MAILNKNNIQKSISIPSRYDDEERNQIGRMMVDQIRRRTANGVSAEGTAFKYARNSPHRGDNLKDSGDMLIELDVVSTSTGSITIGYSDTTTLEAAQAEGNQLGTYGERTPDPTLAKPFIGINNEELDLILAQFDQRQARRTDPDVDAFVNAVLGGLTGG
ncbi:MAG: hypothetical protein NWE76_06290 [Candidatus Bathyarchaeota archaeon]|nr:hypothetical protein [Candidatus Bathyarchaeota archaeon]